MICYTHRPKRCFKIVSKYQKKDKGLGTKMKHLHKALRKINKKSIHHLNLKKTVALQNINNSSSPKMKDTNHQQENQ